MSPTQDKPEEDRVLEQQPFLDTAEAFSDVDGDNDDEKQDLSAPRPSTDKFFQRWRLGVFCVLVVVTILAISAVLLGLNSKSSNVEHSGIPSSHDSSDKADDAASVIHHDEDAPAVPTVRDMSDYVLDLSWDLTVAPTTREYHWTITDAELNPDGVYRPMMLINNQFPGPLVECNDGDTIIVHVDNHAVNATSIHFHGLFQNGTNKMDGTVGVTGCAIAPGSSFTYQFTVTGQSGTYWYHAHHSAQASDGLLGPMIIHAPNERSLQELDYATDRIVMVQDHYHNTTSELLMHYLKPGMENEEPVPDNALINGRGMRDCADFPGWRCNSSDTSITQFDLAKDQRHRLRIMNVGAFAEFSIQFDEHEFYVTEVDGTDVHPESFHRLNIHPAQRYSVVIEANATSTSTSPDTFWMRARMVSHCFRATNKKLEPEIRAIVRYTTPEMQPLTAQPTSKDWPEAVEVICRDLNTSLLHPVQHVKPPPATDYMNLRASFGIGAWRLARGFFNDSTWHMNATNPSLHRFLDAEPHLTTLDSSVGINDLVFEPDTELVLQTTSIRTLDITINNFDDGAHPFHLHGHKFFVLVQGRSGYPPTSEELPDYLDRHGLAQNPLRRDTVTVEGYGWAVLRVVLDSPGLWALHCHNVWHAESGMVMQILSRSDIVRQWEVSAEDRAMCQADGVARGMRPDDSIWFGSFD